MALQFPLYTSDNTFASYLDRLLVKSLGVQAGVVEAEDYKVSAGAGLQVNLKAGKAFVEQTKAREESENSFFNGLYGCFSSLESNPTNNVEVSAANPQIAQIILRVYDTEELGNTGQSKFQIEWINGTPTAEAKESKMKEGIYEGAATLPQSSLRLARVLVPKNATKSSEYYIEDTRNFSNKSFLSIAFHEGTEPVAARQGEMVLMQGSKSVTLPVPTLNSLVGVYSTAAEGPLSIKASKGKIEGPTTGGAVSEVQISTFQYVIFQGTGENYLIISGTPKREQKYIQKTPSKAEWEAGFVISSSRSVLATIYSLVEFSNVSVGGIAIESLIAGKAPITVQVNPGQILKCEPFESNAVQLRYLEL